MHRLYLFGGITVLDFILFAFNKSPVRVCSFSNAQHFLSYVLFYINTRSLRTGNQVSNLQMGTQNSSKTIIQTNNQSTVMRYKVSESQKALIEELGRRQGIKEQPFINQSLATPVIGEASDAGANWYTVSVTILGSVDELESMGSAENLDNNAYFKMANEDARRKIEEAFNTKEFTIHSISNKTRGEMNPLYLD